MVDSRLFAGGAYWRNFRITIPGSGSAQSTLLALIQASADYDAVKDLAIANPDKAVAAKVCDLSADVNFYGPGADMSAPAIAASAVRPWAASKGDWSENVIDLLRWTWVRAQGAGTVTANLIVYYTNVPHIAVG